MISNYQAITLHSYSERGKIWHTKTQYLALPVAKFITSLRAAVKIFHRFTMEKNVFEKTCNLRNRRSTGEMLKLLRLNFVEDLNAYLANLNSEIYHKSFRNYIIREKLSSPIYT